MRSIQGWNGPNSAPTSTVTHNVPWETTTFLFIVLVFTLVLFVIFILINKKWKIFNISEHDARLGKPHHRPGAINIQQFESSSDSDEDISKSKRPKAAMVPMPCSSSQAAAAVAAGELEHSLNDSNPGDKDYYYNSRPLQVTMLKEKQRIYKNIPRYHLQKDSRQSNLISLVENGMYETLSSSSSEYINEMEKHQMIPMKNPSQSKKYNPSSPPCRRDNFIRTKSIDSESPPPSEQGLESIDDPIFEEMSIGEELSSSQAPCGRLEITFDFELLLNTITLHVIQGNNIPSKDVGGGNNTQIRVLLLPNRKQKFKSKIRPGENPQYMESFVFNKINYENLNKYSVRFRLYGCERLRRKKLLGEYILKFNTINIELESTVWINFQPKYYFNWDSHSESGSLARSESNSSTQSIQSGIPELLLGLGYNGTTGRLTVEAIKGSHLRNLTGGKAPDSYIKLVVLDSNGQELDRAKSSLRRAQSNPLFKETFIFQVPLFQISEITLLVSLYGRKGVTRRELLGWFSMGYNNSSEEETTHWEDMYNNMHGNQICRWHIFLKS